MNTFTASSALLSLFLLGTPAAIEAGDQNQLGAFVWLTDAHYDEFYSTENAKIHIEGAPCNLGKDSPLYSAYGCGSSPALVTSAIANAASASAQLGYAKPDFILYTYVEGGAYIPSSRLQARFISPHLLLLYGYAGETLRDTRPMVYH